MAQYGLADIKAMISSGDIHVSSVGIFWGQARLVPGPLAGFPIIGIPATLHLGGRMDSVVYVELAVDAGPGSPGKRGRRRGELLRFSLPSLALFWRGSADDRDGTGLAAYFARVLGEEFPQPQEELVRQFRMPMEELVTHLAQAGFVRAGTTQPAE